MCLLSIRGGNSRFEVAVRRKGPKLLVLFPYLGRTYKKRGNLGAWQQSEFLVIGEGKRRGGERVRENAAVFPSLCESPLPSIYGKLSGGGGKRKKRQGFSEGNSVALVRSRRSLSKKTNRRDLPKIRGKKVMGA